MAENTTAATADLEVQGLLCTPPSPHTLRLIEIRAEAFVPHQDERTHALPRQGQTDLNSGRALGVE
jgi:hypothetical protein